jgi:hypothetical protein
MASARLVRVTIMAISFYCGTGNVQVRVSELTKWCAVSHAAILDRFGPSPQ